MQLLEVLVRLELEILGAILQTWHDGRLLVVTHPPLEEVGLSSVKIIELLRHEHCSWISRLYFMIHTVRIWIPSSRKGSPYCTPLDTLKKPERERERDTKKRPSNTIVDIEWSNEWERERYQKSISNELDVLAHQCWIHTDKSTREGITNKFNLNFNSFFHNKMDPLPTQLLPEQTAEIQNEGLNSPFS